MPTPPRFSTASGRSGKAGCQGLVVERHEGRALPAIGDIGAAEIADGIDAREPRQQPAVADLPGAALLGLMQHRLAMEAEQPDIRRA